MPFPSSATTAGFMVTVRCAAFCGRHAVRQDRVAYQAIHPPLLPFSNAMMRSAQITNQQPVVLHHQHV